MIDRLRKLTDWLGQWRVIAILFIPTLALFCLFNFHPAMVPALVAAGDGVPPLDMQLGYGPQDVESLLTTYGVDGRQRYVRFLLVDMVFAACYGLLFAGLLRVALRPPLVPVASRWNDLCLVALLAGAADCSENLGILALIGLYPYVPPTLALAASCFTLIKWTLAAVGIVSIVAAFGARLFLRAKLRSKLPEEAGT
jgi:hypothetical protein